MQVALNQVAFWSIGRGLAEESREIGSAADPVAASVEFITIGRSYHMNYQTYVWQETGYGNEFMGIILFCNRAGQDCLGASCLSQPRFGSSR